MKIEANIQKIWIYSRFKIRNYLTYKCKLTERVALEFISW